MKTYNEVGHSGPSAAEPLQEHRAAEGFLLPQKNTTETLSCFWELMVYVKLKRIWWQQRWKAMNYSKYVNHPFIIPAMHPFIHQTNQSSIHASLHPGYIAHPATLDSASGYFSLKPNNWGISGLILSTTDWPSPLLAPYTFFIYFLFSLLFFSLYTFIREVIICKDDRPDWPCLNPESVQVKGQEKRSEHL